MPVVDEFEIVDTSPKSNSAARNLVLDAVKAGINTRNTIVKATGLSTEVVDFELEVLRTIEITVHPGPPKTSYWLLGKAPKKRVYLFEGNIREVEDAPDPVVKVEITEEVKLRQQKLLENLTQESNRRRIDISKRPFQGHVNRRPTGIEDFRTDLPVDGKQSSEFPIKVHAGAHTQGELIINLPINIVLLHPENPRDQISTTDQNFLDLRDSIKEKGIQEPLIVALNEDGQTYRTVMGNRRRTAAEHAGLKTVPCIIRSYPNDAAELEVMLIENLQREGLTPTQEARSFKRLMEAHDKNIHAVARKTGMKQSYITSRLQILKLEPVIQSMIDRGEIQLTNAVALNGLPPEEQIRLLPRALRMKVDQVREMVTKSRASRGLKSRLISPEAQTKRVTTDLEKFTRSGAIESLKSLGDIYIHANRLIDAFNDICLDSCLETKDESICHSCPVPRLIESIRRRFAKENLA